MTNRWTSLQSIMRSRTWVLCTHTPLKILPDTFRKWPKKLLWWNTWYKRELPSACWWGTEPRWRRACVCVCVCVGPSATRRGVDGVDSAVLTSAKQCPEQKVPLTGSAHEAEKLGENFKAVNGGQQRPRPWVELSAKRSTFRLASTIRWPVTSGWETSGQSSRKNCPQGETFSAEELGLCSRAPRGQRASSKAPDVTGTRRQRRIVLLCFVPNDDCRQ